MTDALSVLLLNTSLQITSKGFNHCYASLCHAIVAIATVFSSSLCVFLFLSNVL